jgi:hypothetical protein
MADTEKDWDDMTDEEKEAEWNRLISELDLSEGDN